MSPLNNARTKVQELLTTVDLLAASVLHGTARPWRTPTISPERRAEMDYLGHLEKLERSDIAPGETPAPYNLEIGELLVELLAAVENFAETVAQAAGVERLPNATSAYADPKPYLRRIHEHLVAAFDAEPRLAYRAEELCVDLIAKANHALGLTVDGQLLTALCPWCGGRTATAPVGGQPTMRVRLLEGSNPEPVVVCESGTCDPPSSDVGTWHRGHPAWRQHEWDWLAKRLGIAS
jgi:hypothetical protein